MVCHSEREGKLHAGVGEVGWLMRVWWVGMVKRREKVGMPVRVVMVPIRICRIWDEFRGWHMAGESWRESICTIRSVLSGAWWWWMLWLTGSIFIGTFAFLSTF